MKQILHRQYVYDIIQRLFHWWLGLFTLLLIVTGLIASNEDPGTSQAYMWSLHIACGRLLLIGFSGRLVWGLIGPKHARFSALIHLKAWSDSLKSRQMLSADGAFGHHAQASLSYIGFYGLVVLMSFSGIMLAAILHGEGPLADLFLDHFENLNFIRKVHEYGWWLVAAFIVTHVGALIFHEWHDRIPLAQSMISGFQYRTDTNNGKDRKNEK